VPATRWLVQNRGKRFLLVGSDYLFPRATNAIVRKTLEQMGGSVADELYLSLDSSDFSSVIASIKRHKPEVILSTVVGGSNKPFFHQMNAAGIKGSNTAIMCLAVTEIEALDIGIDKMADVLSCMSYFQSLSRIRNQQFITAFKNRFGAQRVLNDPMESAYCAVHLWRKAAQRAAALGTAQVVAAAGGMDFSAPSGYVKLDQQNHHTWKYARIGKFARDGQVQVLYESPLIQPNPFFNT
jgi:urea transport system substrate-binding protein